MTREQQPRTDTERLDWVHRNYVHFVAAWWGIDEKGVPYKWTEIQWTPFPLYQAHPEYGRRQLSRYAGTWRDVIDYAMTLSAGMDEWRPADSLSSHRLEASDA